MMSRTLVLGLTAFLTLGMAAGCVDSGKVRYHGDETGTDHGPVDTRDQPVYFYLSGVSIPAVQDDGSVACCRDFDDDGAVDNRLAEDFEAIAGTVLGDSAGTLAANGFDGILNTLISKGSFAAVIEATNLPKNVGDATDGVGVSVYKADSISSWNDRKGGDGTFVLDGDALAQTTGAATQNGVLDGDLADVTIPWNGAFFGGAHTSGTLTVRDVHLNVQLEDRGETTPSDRVASTDATMDADGHAVNYLTGLVGGEDVVAAANRLFASQCDLSGDLLQFEDAPSGANADVPTLTLDSDVVDALSQSDDAYCQSLPARVPDLASAFDIDTDGNGTADAISVGFHIQLVHADVIPARTKPLYLYVSGMVAPNPIGHGNFDCCYDFDEDGTLDNNVFVAIGKLVNNLAGTDAIIDNFDDITGMLSDLIQSDHLDVLFKADGYPVHPADGAAIDLNLYKAESQSAWADRLAGNGVFSLISDAMLVQSKATNRAGVIRATANYLPMPWNATLGGVSVSSKVTLVNARIHLEVAEDADGNLTFPNHSTDADGNPVNYLAGALRGQQLIKAANAVIGAYCDLPNTLLTYREEEDPNAPVPGAPTIGVHQGMLNQLQSLDPTANPICKAIGDNAEAKIPGVEALFDVDTTGDGLHDSMSLGLRLQLSSAQSVDGNGHL